MRRLLLSTAALVFLAAPVLADPHGGGGRGGEGHANHIGKASMDPQVQERAQAESRHQAPPQAAPMERGDHGRSVGFDRHGPDDRRAFNDGRPRPENRPDNRAFNDNRRTDFNRDGRTDFRPNDRRGPGMGGPRHDFSGFRDYHRDFRVTRRFYAPAYRRPAGWYEHRWTYGEYLPAAFWVRDYWLIDFADYDLPPPPFGAVWVRVGPDALLIDEDNGEIITVAYDVFY